MSSFSLTETWQTIAPATVRPAFRRTKIVCTLGPATTEPETIYELAVAGMDVARLNFSHGTHEEHLERLAAVRVAQERLGRPIAVLADLCGPKIRVTGLHEPMHVAAGDPLVLTAPERAQSGELGVSFPALLAQVVAPGDEVLIDDGRIRARAVGSDGTRLLCRIETGGTIAPCKGINLPSSSLPIPALTEKDRVDLQFALAAGADYVALSFVRTAGDVQELRGLIDAAGSSARIIAKIEKAEAVVNLDAIVAAADAVMVARGDLGVEIGVSKVPLVQKRIIDSARAAGRAVITATQMLESMIHAPEPTRAEVSDVANAIFDGTSAIMLSAETAAGAYPLEAVAQMDAIARSVEPSLVYERRVREGADIAEILTHGACDLADDIGAPVIAVSTETGATARLVSRFRPQGPIAAAATDLGVLQQLALEWAVVPVLVDEPPSIEAGWADIVDRVLQQGLAEPGETIVLTGRADSRLGGATNHVFLHRVDQPQEHRDRVQRQGRRLRERALREAVAGG
ncbi:MAG TPA: pyruvate kinase [Gaiellaceae bacterium]|nr:pyruvate kinase [Gaiellaceae bacterium]